MICDSCGRVLDPDNYVEVENLESGEVTRLCFTCVEILNQVYEKEVNTIGY